MPFDFPLLRECGALTGKRVLLRLNLDVPIENGVLLDTYRIERVRHTLDFLKKEGAKTLIISHIGRDPKETLRPVFNYLKEFLPVEFVSSLSSAKEKIYQLPEGEFLLLENLRSFSGEAQNDSVFAGELASLADMYVNEAFAVSHRKHASIVGIPTLLPSYAGFLFEEEVKHLSRAFSPAHPMLIILGGAKFETKMPLVKKFLAIADEIYVCGALANDIYKARGYEVGVSLISSVPPAPAILENSKLQAPVDVVVCGRSGPKEKIADTVAPEEKIVDAGPHALNDISELIEKAKFVIWNGPLGEYEAGFDAGTKAVAQALAESDTESIIGGGDSIAVVSKLGLLERFSFVSTGGGAMLEFLTDETLPGIKALEGRR